MVRKISNFSRNRVTLTVMRNRARIWKKNKIGHDFVGIFLSCDSPTTCRAIWLWYFYWEVEIQIQIQRIVMFAWEAFYYNYYVTMESQLKIKGLCSHRYNQEIVTSYSNTSPICDLPNSNWISIIKYIPIVVVNCKKKRRRSHQWDYYQKYTKLFLWINIYFINILCNFSPSLFHACEDYARGEKM